MLAMGRTPKNRTQEDTELLSWAAQEALDRRGVSARQASVLLAAKLGFPVSNQTISQAVRGIGGEAAIRAIEALLEIKREQWKEARDAQRLARGELDPFSRYPILGERLRLAKAARAMRGDQLPSEVWDYVEDSLRGLALKGEMTREIADQAIDAAIRQVRQRAEDPLPEAKHVDVKPNLVQVVRRRRS